MKPFTPHRCATCTRPAPPPPRKGNYDYDYGSKKAQARHMALGLCNCLRCMRCWGVIDGACENSPHCESLEPYAWEEENERLLAERGREAAKLASEPPAPF
jgi:hypothetical protein